MSFIQRIWYLFVLLYNQQSRRNHFHWENYLKKNEVVLIIHNNDFSIRELLNAMWATTFFELFCGIFRFFCTFWDSHFIPLQVDSETPYFLANFLWDFPAIQYWLLFKRFKNETTLFCKLNMYYFSNTNIEMRALWN